MYTFPASPKPSYTYDKGEEFNTLINPYASGKESRAKLMRFPKHNFACVYRNILLADRNTLHDFYRRVFGSGDSFWYVDFQSRKWIDEYIGRGLVIPPTGAVAFDAAVETDEIAAAINSTANDMTLTPAVPAVNDAYYFGYTTPWTCLRLNIGTQGVGTWTVVWEYYKSGATWASLSDVVDGTTSFKAAAGNHDVLWTKPSDWIVKTIQGDSLYWVRARVSAYTSITTQPKGTQCWVGDIYHDLHGVTTSAYAIYIDGVAKTGGGTDYTWISGGGEAGSDRIKLVSMPTIGSLITSDHTGFLRIKGRLEKDAFKESIDESDPSNPAFNCQFNLVEVQW